jgi:hypothetical protein
MADFDGSGKLFAKRQIERKSCLGQDDQSFRRIVGETATRG